MRLGQKTDYLNTNGQNTNAKFGISSFYFTLNKIGICGNHKNENINEHVCILYTM